MRRGSLRSCAAGILLVFCAGTLISPHHHLNPIADLITDGRSDSGVIVLPTSRIPPAEGPVVGEARTVTDEPCLACFWHDMTASAATRFAFGIVIVMLAVVGAPALESHSFVFLSLLPSRGPPV